MKYMKGLTGATLIIHAPDVLVIGFIIGAIGVGPLAYSVGRYWSEIERIVQ